MTKLRIQGAFYLFILSAAVAVFSNAVSCGTVARGQADTRSSFIDKAVVLTADGTDPVPKPPTPPLSVELTA